MSLTEVMVLPSPIEGGPSLALHLVKRPGRCLTEAIRPPELSTGAVGLIPGKDVMPSLGAPCQQEWDLAQSPQHPIVMGIVMKAPVVEVPLVGAPFAEVALAGALPVGAPLVGAPLAGAPPEGAPGGGDLNPKSETY